MKQFQSPERFARIYAFSGATLAVLLCGLFLFAAMRTNPRTTLDPKQKQLLQRRIALQAQIELCAMRSRGELPGASKHCNDDEQRKLPDLRRELTEIDASLKLR